VIFWDPQFFFAVQPNGLQASTLRRHHIQLGIIAYVQYFFGQHTQGLSTRMKHFGVRLCHT
jgi:hypothetical protein